MNVKYFDLANEVLDTALADLIIYLAGKEHYSAMVNGVIEGYAKNVWSASVVDITAVVTLVLKDGVDRQEITLDRANALLDKLTTALNHTTSYLYEDAN